MSTKPDHSISLNPWKALHFPKEVMLERTEEELVEGCKAGDRQAQKRVYDHYAGPMLMVCRRYARDDHEAQDMLHDGFLKVFLKIESFQGRAALKTWISRVMVNNCLSSLRKKLKRGFQVTLEQTQIPEPEVPEVALKDYEHLSAQDVFDAIKELPLGYRTVFSMFVLDDFQHREIAEQLEISEGTSKSQLSKAKKMLYKLLTEKSES